MNISVTFRHVDPSDSIKRYAEEKLAKVQKFLRRPMTARVTVALDKLRHRVEVRVSSGADHYEAHEATEDMYASIDKVIDKLERQIRGTRGAQESRKTRGGATLRVGADSGELTAAAPRRASVRPAAARASSAPPAAAKKAPAKKAPAKKKAAKKKKKG